MTSNLQFGSSEGYYQNNYAILLSIFGTVPLLLMLILCTCWKRTRQKDELMGLPGIVTPKNPEEITNDIAKSGEPPVLNGSITIAIAVDDVDSNKRPVSLATKHRRSLPDIPIPDLTLQCDPNDNSSDLYATVHQPYNIGGSSITDPQSSISQPDDPYSRVESNSKRTENPYAIVNESTNKSIEINNYEIEGTILAAAKLLQPSTSAQIASTAHAAPHPHAPPPLPLPSPTDSLSTSLRLAQNNNNTATNQQLMVVDAILHNPATDNISAALAVRGDWAASQELPYITPPNVTGGPQVNFSGDSQDSSKGYTSITVRAPLKDIMKDAPYSDDSDEMYQTIPDQSNYTSGSETYAQIQPQITVAVEINNLHLQEQANLDYINESNAASSESSKVTQHCHSRQGSNSSSIQIISSPKPERRPVNSPLPPTPSSVAASLDKPIQNVNDMYAKVNKKPKRNDLTDENKSKNPPNKMPGTPPLEQVSDKTYVRKIEHNYETIKTSPKKNSQQQNSLDSDPGYEKLQPRNANAEPATLELSDPNYEQLRPKSPTLQHANNSTTSSVNSSNCQQQQLTVDGYSVIRHHQGRQSNQSSVSSDILTRNSLDEPNYESMPNSENSDLSCDLNVEQQQKELLNVEYKRLHTSNSDDCDSLKRRKVTARSSNTTSKSSGLADLSSATTSNSDELVDPKSYESLCKSDLDEPNYESVKYDDLMAETLGEDAKLLAKQEVEGYDDGYEKIQKNSGKIEKHNSDNPDYETIGKVRHNAEDFFEV